jgi:hypothetical protein
LQKTLKRRQFEIFLVGLQCSSKGKRRVVSCLNGTGWIVMIGIQEAGVTNDFSANGRILNWKRKKAQVVIIFERKVGKTPYT